MCQGISVLEQEKLDNVMIEMDGTDNKCKPPLHPSPSDDTQACSRNLPGGGGGEGVGAWLRGCSACDRFCVASQLSSGPILFWEYRWPYAKPALRRKASPCTVTLLTWQEIQTWFFRFQ